LASSFRLTPFDIYLLSIGCHDNGYVTTIRSHITSGFKDKLILLQSYAEHAAGFDGLELPVLAIPDLFISQKLVFTPSQDPPVASRSHSPSLSDAPIQDILSLGTGRGDIGQYNGLGYRALASHYSPAINAGLLLGQAEGFSMFGSETTSDHGNTEDYTTNTPVLRRLDPQVVRMTGFKM
jgi:hypothetical protein